VAKEGEVLGVVSMKISLEHVNAKAHEFMMKIVGVALLLSVPLMLFVLSVCDEIGHSATAYRARLFGGNRQG
jgi:sensor histidine kinase regulating citrate/malate metabolism